MSPAGSVVVIGAGVAGFTVVDELRRGGFGGRVVLVGEEPHPPYDRPPLSKQVLLGTWEHGRAALATAEAMIELDVDLRLGVVARSLDVGRRSVTLSDGTAVSADEVVVATGSRAVVPGWVRLGPRVMALRTLDDARRLGDALRDSRRLVVVGTGFLGLEVAAAARSLGVGDVRVLGPLEPMVTAVGETVSRRLRALHEAHGVVLEVGPEVGAVDGDVAGATVRLADRKVRAEAVVVALGARPNVEWLAGSGLAVDGGVAVDGRGRAAPGIHAVGEVCRWPDRSGAHRRIDHRLAASEQARAVAGDLLGEPEAAPLVPFWWSDQYDVRVQAYGRTGPGREESWLSGGPDDPSFALAQRDGDLVGGVVGWNAARATRQGRALAADPTPWPVSAAT